MINFIYLSKIRTLNLESLFCYEYNILGATLTTELILYQIVLLRKIRL